MKALKLRCNSHERILSLCLTSTSRSSSRLLACLLAPLTGLHQDELTRSVNGPNLPFTSTPECCGAASRSGRSPQQHALKGFTALGIPHTIALGWIRLGERKDQRHTDLCSKAHDLRP